MQCISIGVILLPETYIHDDWDNAFMTDLLRNKTPVLQLMDNFGFSVDKCDQELD